MPPPEGPNVTVGIPRDTARIFESHTEDREELSLELVESNTYEILERLKAKTLHFAIVRTPFAQNDFSQISLIHGRIVAVGKSEFFSKLNKPHDDDECVSESLNDTRAICLGDLSEMPLIVYRRWERVIKQLFQSNKMDFTIKCLNDNAATSLYYAQMGLGVALVPSSAIHEDDKGLVVYELENDPLLTDIILLHHREANIPILAEQLMEHLKETLSQSI